MRSSSTSKMPGLAMFAQLLNSPWNSGSASTPTSPVTSRGVALRFSRALRRPGVTPPRAAYVKQQAPPRCSSSPLAKGTDAVSRPVSRAVRIRAIWLTALVVSLAFLTADSAFAQTSPSAMLDQYRSVRGTWLTVAASYANRLFGLLALIEFAWTGAILVLERTDLQGWTAALIRKMMFIGAFFALLNFGADWIPRIIESFQIVGQSASGLPSLAPTDILVRGLSVAGNLLSGAANSGWMGTFGTALALVFAALLAFLAFLGLTIQLVVTLVESYLVIGAGFIFLGFGGSRWTVPYVERYIAYAVSTGVKVMVLYLLLGAGMTLTNTWEAAATAVPTSASPAVDALDISASAVILLMICWNAPKLAAGILGGTPSFTGGDAVSTAGGIAQGVLLVGAAAAGGVALGAKVLAAKGGSMAVGQAAGMGAGSAASGGMGGGFGSPGSTGAGGPTGSSGPRPGSGGGGAAGNPGGQSGPAPQSSAPNGTEPSKAAPSGKDGTKSQDNSSHNRSTAPSGQNGSGGTTNKTTSSNAERQVSPPSPSTQAKDETGRTARTGEVTSRVSRKLAAGTQFVRMARSAIPPDHAPHGAPPALRSEGEE